MVSSNQQDIKAFQFIADKLTIYGPKVDGGFRVTLEVGEHMFDSIKDLPRLNGHQIVVAIVPGEEIERKQKENKVSEEVKTEGQLMKASSEDLLKEDD